MIRCEKRADADAHRKNALNFKKAAARHLAEKKFKVKVLHDEDGDGLTSRAKMRWAALMHGIFQI